MNKQLIEMASKCAWDIDEYLYTHVSDSGKNSFFQEAINRINGLNNSSYKNSSHSYTSSYIIKSLYKGKKDIFINPNDVIYLLKESDFSVKYLRSESQCRITIEYQGLTFIHDNLTKNFKIFTLKENEDFYKKVDIISFFKVFKLIDKALKNEYEIDETLGKIFTPKYKSFYYGFTDRKEPINYDKLDLSNKDFNVYNNLIFFLDEKKYNDFFTYLLEKEIININNIDEYISNLSSLSLSNFERQFKNIGFDDNPFFIQANIQEKLTPFIEKIKSHVLFNELNNNISVKESNKKSIKI